MGRLRYKKKVLNLGSGTESGGWGQSDTGLPLISQRLHIPSGKQDAEKSSKSLPIHSGRAERKSKGDVKWVGVVRQPGASK